MRNLFILSQRALFWDLIAISSVCAQPPALFRWNRKADFENFLRTIWNDSVKFPVYVALCLLSQTRAYLGNIVCVRIAGSTSVTVTVFKIKRRTVVVYLWRLRSLYNLLKSNVHLVLWGWSEERGFRKDAAWQPWCSNRCCVLLHSGLHKNSMSPQRGREIRDFCIMKQVHKDACVTNVSFSQYRRQLCLPGEVEKGLESVTVAGLKRKKKKKKIQSMIYWP